MSRTNQILLAFIFGQALQLVLHGLGDKLVTVNPLLACLVVGLLVTAALYLGSLLANHEQDETNMTIEEVFGDEAETD